MFDLVVDEWLKILVIAINKAIMVIHNNINKWLSLGFSMNIMVIDKWQSITSNNGGITSKNGLR